MKRSRPASSGTLSAPAADRRPRGPALSRVLPSTVGALIAASAAALLLATLLPTEARAQHRRAAAVPHVPDAPGELLVGLGGSLEDGSFFPVSGLRGDLARLGTLTVSYAFAPGAVFRIQGDVLRVLSVEAREREPAVPLDEDVADGTTHDAGDFRLSTLFRVLGDPDGLSAGLHLAVKLPNSDEAAGIGLNTTDVFAGGFASWAAGPVRVNGRLGVGILEAPLERFVQDDVLTYGGEVLLRPEGWDVRLAASAAGRANTRSVVPVGNEDRGRAALGLELLADDWRADFGVRRGYAGNSPDWSLVAGVARIFGP